MIDLHVHTWRCRHGAGTAEEYVRAAADGGIGLIAFTEHLPLAPGMAAALPGAESYVVPADEVEEYIAEVAAARSLGESLGVEVLCGAEVDAVAGNLEYAEQLLARYEFDVVLGSVHFIGDWAFDDPDRTERYAEWDVAELWDRYFQDLAWAARSGLADVMAHPDLAKKFCYVPEGDLRHLYAAAAEAFASAEVAFEVNTAGLRKPCRELYPSDAFLAELHRAGVAATIGSDAHRPGELGSGLTDAVRALRQAGYTSVLVFEGRVPREVGLDEL